MRKMKPITALYVRTSTDKQDKGAKTQLKALKDFCKSRGIKKIEIYQDLNVSGAKSSRPELDRMKEDIEAGLVHSVISYSLSRLSRSVQDLIKTMEFFGKNQVDFATVKENDIDTTSAMGKLFFHLMGAMAEFERECLSERTKDGMRTAKANGSKVGRDKTVNRDKVRKFKKKGYSLQEIADACDCSKTTAHRIVKELNL